MSLCSYLCAQTEYGETPLGDVARSFRKAKAAPDAVIDNDNLPKVMDEGEIRRAAGASPTFSFDPGRKNVNVSSADVTCSLSFTGKTTAESDPALLDDLPRSELAKLDGPAVINGDSLQISVHNGTAWELREVLIGLTIVKQAQTGETSVHAGPHIIPASAAGDTQPGNLSSSQLQDHMQQSDSVLKQPDVTLLLRVKGTAAPATTASFRTALNFALFPDQEWHWAIVKAKGLPPQGSPAEASMTTPAKESQSSAISHDATIVPAAMVRGDAKSSVQAEPTAPIH